ncbi:MAG: hypothetical protein KDA78_07410 [Planctomycetaceae bacterium]|nr:hypothetical protein [Planctomycetaceae bacterium]
MAGLTETSLFGAEPYLKFVQGLRERQYYDTAMLYLQTLETRQDVPAEIREVIPFERAVTMLESSSFSQNAEAQEELLDQAQAYLEQFIKTSPQHELAARANTELANIMIGKARVLVWDSRSPSNADNRLKFQQDARGLIQKARQIYQTAHDAYKTEWESYGVYIPEDETEKRQKREVAEGLYMRSQLDLATCTYEEAQTYDVGSKEFLDILKKASLEFEDLHSKYRSQYAGLFARTMQGKCFEEQGDIRKALGIYDELLGHPGRSEGLRRLQSQVRHFRLICLNHESRKDYQLVIIEADEWMKENRAYTRSTTGLGIRWEMAQAQEHHAMDRNTPEGDRTRLLRQALENAREINKYAGPFKDVSNSMIQRLLVALDREPGDPKDFDSAFGSANTMLEQIGKIREQLKLAEKSGNKQEIENVQGELQAMLSETERLYRLALALVDSSVDNSQINATRYRLAYMYYLQRKSYETAVVADYVSSRALHSDQTLALDGAYLALAGLMQAINDAPQDRKKDAVSLMVGMCERIATTWPDSDRATDARMEMGRIYRQYDQPLDAAKWYSEVPQTVTQFPTAQIEAGQAYWNAYMTTIVKADSTVTPEELKEWQNQAAVHLERGITEKQKSVPESQETPAELIRAKVSLAQIEIMRGNDGKAVELLTVEPHSVIKAISVAEGTARPKEDFEIKSATFASFTYQQLLRAYIGTKQLDKAEETRGMLEQVAGESGGGEALTAVYIELGRELQNELERLRKQNDLERLKNVRSGFEAFLNQLFERKTGQTYGSLIWIAETYFGLAEGSGEDPAKAKQYYSSAAKTYGEIIKRGENDTKFIDPARLTGVRLRLVNCLKEEGNFPVAEETIKKVLASNPKALDAQIAAAEVYQAWGEKDKDAEKFLDAVRGKKFEDGTVIWGWGDISKRLLMIIDAGNAPDDYKSRNREVQFKLAQSRFQYADMITDLSASEDQLRRAKADIVTFAQYSPDLVETPWWSQFDELYQDVQRGLGEAIVPLQKPTEGLVSETPEESRYSTPEEDERAHAEKTPAETAPAEQPSSLGSYLMMGLAALIGLGILGYTFTVSAKPRKKKSTAELIARMPKGSSSRKSKPAPAAEQSEDRPKPSRKPEGTSSSGSQSGKRREAPQTPEGAEKPRPRKKPPAQEG